MADPKNWRLNSHSFHRLPMSEAKETLSYLKELDAELQGAIHVCRNRVAALKDLEIAELHNEIEQLKKSTN